MSIYMEYDSLPCEIVWQLYEEFSARNTLESEVEWYKERQVFTKFLGRPQTECGLWRGPEPFFAFLAAP